jgi:hypothetical protein
MAGTKEKLLTSSYISSGPGVICGEIARVYPGSKRVELPLGKRKRRHPAGRSILDQVLNLTFAAASHVAAIDERRGTIPALSAFAVATLTMLRKQFFGVAEIGTPCAGNLTDSLGYNQSGCS